MDAAIIELDPLADPDRARAHHRYRGVPAADDLVLVLVGGVVIGRHRLELGGTGIDLAEGRLQRRDPYSAARELRDPGVVKARALCSKQEIVGKPPP